MNWEAIGAAGELVGAIAVVVTLIYLARQIRENSRVVQSASSQTLADSVSNWLNELIRDENVAEIFSRGLRNPEDLSQNERIRFNAIISSAFFQYQNTYMKTRTQTIDTEFWKGTEQAIRYYLSQPGVQRWLQTSSMGLSKPFLNYLRKVSEQNRSD